MNAIPNDDSPNVSMALDHVIRAHGFLAVLLALVWRPVRRLGENRNKHDLPLSGHLLRDIGLEHQSDTDRSREHLLVTAMVLRGGL